MLFQNQGSISESHEASEDELGSLTWQDISTRNIAVWETVIQEITLEDEDKRPKQLFELAHDTAITSMGIHVIIRSSSASSAHNN